MAVAAGDEALAVGIAALAEENSGYARARIMDLQLDPSLANGATARSDELGESLVVRSSTIVESSGTWAGAFASYEDLGPGEVPLGIKGCWASAFGAHVLGRAEMSATKPSHFGMAVLVQKQLNPTHGGVASVGASGEVTIAAVEGSPAAIVSGWERGEVAVVSAPDVAPAAGPADEPSMFGDVARLATDTKSAVSCNHIEWAMTDGELWLLQANTLPVARAGASAAPQSALFTDPRSVSLAGTLAAYPGHTGGRLVVSWGLGSSLPQPVAVSPHKSLIEIYDTAVALADSLRTTRWGAAQAGLSGGLPTVLTRPQHDSANSLDELFNDAGLDKKKASELLGLLDALGRRLADEGRIAAPGWLWHLDTRSLEAAVRGEDGRYDPATRVGVSRTEPFLYGAVSAGGVGVKGRAAAPGWGAGRLRMVRNAADTQSVLPREVVAAVYPLNNLAPLLWNAAGVITTGGSPGAHLFEVASWLGVPAVCGVDLESLFGATLDVASSEPMALAAVDGDQGIAWLVDDT